MNKPAGVPEALDQAGVGGREDRRRETAGNKNKNDDNNNNNDSKHAYASTAE
jgi:hypothetical protein